MPTRAYLSLDERNRRFAIERAQRAGSLAAAGLRGREREVASLVLRRGSLSVKQVRRLLSVQISSAAVRTMLNRLVRKGVLERTRVTSQRASLYSPAPDQELTAELIARQLADEFFEGSLQRLASALTDFR